MSKIAIATALSCFSLFMTVQAQQRTEIPLSGPGWKLWYDSTASWKNDELYPPGTSIAAITAAQPTGGWTALHSAGVKDVSVPGTVEEYYQQQPGPAGDLSGVSWWWRTVRIPASASPRRLLLRFEAARYRSEVFIGQRLAGYDLTGNTPFEVDITRFASPGETVQLAVRVTDPGGNYDWRDGDQVAWGTHKVPGSHAFGGITGRVTLVSCDPVYVDDIYIKNTPAITEIHPHITIVNSGSGRAVRSVIVTVADRNEPAKELYRQELRDVALVPGATLLPLTISLPAAKVWDVDHPTLYRCTVSLVDGSTITDTDDKRFGFRWFEPVGQGSDAMFRLNGKRIVLRTAISWGFWPVNGIYPTAELAEKQIRAAKSMGLNMLNFHRCIGSPIILEKADELGLLYYEEPGNYRSGQNPDDTLAHALMREKVLRMVKRDRSHPSLVMFNLINEMGPVSVTLMNVHIADMLNAHRVDPSRTFTHTSSWCRTEDNDQARVHLRPNDTTVYWHGWYDFHHAGGPPVWGQDAYRNPAEYYNATANTKDIVFWGEEGAISTPPRLEKIKASLDASPVTGWDGVMYRDWYAAFDSFIARKHLRAAFPTVDALTTAMGNISIEHQGRKIETIRIDNYSDGYAINGWESQIIENHSGVVDCFRNVKGDTGLIAWYNQPLYVAVKTRQQIVDVQGTVVTDLYIVNEKNLTGSHRLVVTVTDPAGGRIFRKETDVTISGGDVYGQLIAEGLELPASGTGGMCRIDAALTDAQGTVEARGREQFLAVDWRSPALPGAGAVWEHADVLGKFLREEKKVPMQQYSNAAGRLDWVVVSRPPTGAAVTVVPPEHFETADGARGVTVTFYKDDAFREKISQRTDRNIDLTVPMGATPDPSVTTTEKYSIAWDARLNPTIDGKYYLDLQTSGYASLIVNGDTVLTFTKNSGGHEKIRLDLTKGRPVTVSVCLRHVRNTAGRCVLQWSTPEADPADPQKLIDRVRTEGTTLIVADNADTWMELLAANTTARVAGKFLVGTAWLGGVHFVKAHPLFTGLPVNDGMNWPYQAVVKNGAERYGIEIEGEECIAAAYHAYPMKLGTAVGSLACGKGRIVFSTLELCGNLGSKESAAAVAKKLLCNFIMYGGK